MTDAISPPEVARPALAQARVTPPRVPPLVTSCPRCEAPSQPRPAVQTCGHCKRSFLLVGGALLDGNVVPPMAAPGVIKVRASGTLQRTQGAVGPLGISHGTLDPITGHIPMDSLSIPWPDIYSIALWRRPDWLSFLVTTVLLGPVALGLVAATFGVPALAVLSVPVLAGFVYLVTRAFKVGAQFMRVCGSRLVLTIRYDQPAWRRKRFVRETFLRAGLPIPRGAEALSLELE